MSERRKVNEILADRRRRAELRRDQRVQQLCRQVPEFDELEKQRRDAGRELVRVTLERGDVAAIRERLRQIQLRRERILAERGIEPSFFEPDYTCPLCGDTGFVDGKSCSCRRQLQIERNVDMSSVRGLLDEQNFERFDLGLFRRDRQPGESVSPYENMQELVRLMRDEYVAFFGGKSPNIFLFGPTGVGKTYLAHCVVKGVLDKGFTVLYQTAPQLLDFLTEYSFSYQENREQRRERYDFCFQADLLVIDDLGAEFTTAKMLSELFELLNARLLAKRPTLISSNARPDELISLYDSRIASRIQGEYVIFELFGSDLRQRP